MKWRGRRTDRELRIRIESVNAPNLYRDRDLMSGPGVRARVDSGQKRIVSSDQVEDHFVAEELRNIDRRRDRFRCA